LHLKKIQVILRPFEDYGDFIKFPDPLVYALYQFGLALEIRGQSMILSLDGSAWIASLHNPARFSFYLLEKGDWTCCPSGHGLTPEIAQ